MFWVLSLGFCCFLGANLLFVRYYSVLSVAAVYDDYNDMYVLSLGYAQ